jgi:hypothetical protein
MVNGLGADVRRFWYVDERGQVFTAESVQAGAKAVLMREDKTAPNPRIILRDLYQGDWLAGMERLSKTPPAFLPSHCYLAELDESPFVEDGLRSAPHRQLHSLVVGIPREPGDES